MQLKASHFFHCISFIHKWPKIFLLATIILIDFTPLCTILSNKSIFRWIYQVCVLCPHVLTTASMCVIPSCLLEQQAYSWKLSAKRNVLLECCLSYMKAKGPFKKRFPCMKKRFLICATQGECSLPKCPFYCSKLWACPPTETKARPRLISWSCGGSTAVL